MNTMEQSKTISVGRRKGECLRLLERQLLVPSHGREKGGKLGKGNRSDVYEPGPMPALHILSMWPTLLSCEERGLLCLTGKKTSFG